ncbi:MAG: hypothetical protein LBR53_13365 [Deltaproteobacteria bacterium]|jgi:signal transduction histidine kinase|nr:hypothetical protein [Deltaproteobacteria bacterium]
MTDNPKNEVKLKKRAKIQISVFLGLLFVCLLVITVFTGLKEIDNIRAVNSLVSEIYDTKLPELVDNQKLLQNIENLRRYAEVAYVSDNVDIRREARLNARELVSESISLSSDSIHSDSLMAARTIDGMVRIRNQIDKHQSDLRSALSNYISALNSFTRYLDAQTYNTFIYGFFVNNFLFPPDNLVKISIPEFNSELETHIVYLTELHASVRPKLSLVEKKSFDDSYANLEMSLDLILVSFRDINKLKSELEIKWNEIDLLLKKMRNKVRLGAESSVHNMLSVIIKKSESTELSSYILFGIIILFLVIDYFILHFFLTNPLRWATEKLHQLRAGGSVEDFPHIYIYEIAKLASLLDVFSEHLAGLYTQANFLEGEAARKKDLEHLMVAVFNASLDGYVVWNHKQVVFVSPGTLTLLGLSSVEEFSDSYENFGFSSSHLRDMLNITADSGREREECALITKNGSFISVELTYIPVNYHSTKCLLTYIRDLRQLTMREADLRIAKEQADAANKAKSNFLSAMSHELKSPMNGILGLTRLLLSTDITKLQKEYLYSLEESTRALLNIIDNILDFSYLENGRLPLDEKKFTLEKILNDVLEFNQAQSTLRGIPVSFNIDPSASSSYEGDSDKLFQIVNNLVSNALKFTEHGFINISVFEKNVEEARDAVFDSDSQKTTGGAEESFSSSGSVINFSKTEGGAGGKTGMVMLHFTVKDTGIGISPDLKPNLFTAFSIGDPSPSRKHGGTGIGLALSKNLVNIMGGKIWCESEPGQGSVFHFTVLVAPVKEADESSSSSGS